MDKIRGYDFHQDKTFLGEKLTTNNIFKSNFELFDEITDEQIPKLQQSNILITFGCSWTWGIGSSYTENIKNADDLETSILINEDYNNWNDVYSYRGLVTNKYNFTNLNFSKPGSSNQKQFRFAREFFTNTKNINLLKQAKNVIIMWGITSTARTEFWYNETNKFESVVFNNNEEGHIPTGFGLKRKTNLVSHNDTHDVVRVLILDLYNHEIGHSADGSAFSSYIESSDFDLDPDGERFMFVSKFIPDIEFRDQVSTSDTVTVNIKGRNYPLESLTTLSTISVTPESTFANTRARSRQCAIRVSSNDIDYGWRLGDIRLEIRPDGRR